MPDRSLARFCVACEWVRSSVGQHLADVPGDGGYRGHRARVVHAGWADDAECRDRLGAWTVSGCDHRGRHQLFMLHLVTDPDGDPAGARRLAEQLQQDDVLLESLE